jgi:hypothetical protein
MARRRNAPVPSQNLQAFSGVPNTPQADGVILPVAAYTAATYTSNPYSNYNYRGLRLYFNVTNANGGTLTVTVQVQDPVSGTWVTDSSALEVSPGIVANGVTTMLIYPGVNEVANKDIGYPLGMIWRISAVVATATMTFGVSGEYLE